MHSIGIHEMLKRYLIGDGATFTTLGEHIWFRFMDLTECVEFTVEMAHAALDTHLRKEVKFLALFDDVAKYINDRHDLRSSDLPALIVTTYRNGGKLSSKRRKRFADRVQTVLDDVEATVANRRLSLSLSGGGAT